MGPLIPGSYISDHRMIILSTNIPEPKPKDKMNRVCNLTDNKEQHFIEEFNNTAILNTSNLTDATNQLNSEILRTMDKIAPQQLKKITSRIKKPWYDNDLKHQRQIVKNRERKWLKYREQLHWKAYKRERNRFITMIKYKKRDHLHNQISATTGNSKKLYQLITNLTGQNKSNPLPASTSDGNLADEFATYFLEKIHNIRKLFDGIPNYKPTPTNTPPLNTFSTLPESQLYKIIMEMPSTTCELDIIPTKFLKKVLMHCIPALTKVVNLSLSSGHFFEDWKLAIVRPLIKSLKKGTEKSNYRPVSHLQFISKVVEKCTLSQLPNHCNKYNLLPEYQSAYRKHYSCETSLLKLVNDTLWAMENKLITAVTVMDLSAAFDTVSHELLLTVLREQFGINDVAINWYENYLKPRCFKVCINGKYSAQKTMDFSVPQGSTQGAYLFICYASTLNEIVPKSLTLNGFADHHSIRKSFRPTAPKTNSSSVNTDEDDTITIMQNSMLDIKSWMDAIKLKLNETKTEFIYFGGKHQLAKT